MFFKVSAYSGSSEGSVSPRPVKLYSRLDSKTHRVVPIECAPAIWHYLIDQYYSVCCSVEIRKCICYSSIPDNNIGLILTIPESVTRSIMSRPWVWNLVRRVVKLEEADGMFAEASEASETLPSFLPVKTFHIGLWNYMQKNSISSISPSLTHINVQGGSS